MKLSLVSSALTSCIEAGLPVHLWGTFGVGKSDVVRETAAKLGLDLIDIRATLLDPVDLRGLPHVAEGRANWAVPAFLPTAGNGILFLDELTSAPQQTQAACYQLILDRRIGEYELPDGWIVIAAGNLATDRGVTHSMPMPLRNRFVHLEIEPDIDDWCVWAVNPEATREFAGAPRPVAKAAAIRPEIVAYQRFRGGEALHQWDPARDRDAKGVPTPRTWTYVSRLLDAGPSPEVEHELFAGCVGPGAAIEFSAFLRMYRELPSLDGIMLDPERAPVPTQPNALYAVATALAARSTPANFGTVLRYSARMPQEFEVMLVKDAHRRDKAIEKTRPFTLWVMEHTDVLFG